MLLPWRVFLIKGEVFQKKMGISVPYRVLCVGMVHGLYLNILKTSSCLGKHSAVDAGTSLCSELMCVDGSLHKTLVFLIKIKCF